MELGVRDEERGAIYPGVVRVYVIVAYDISDDRKRIKAMNKLIMMGFKRLQKSVYYRKGGRGVAKDAVRALKRIVDKGDSIFVIVVQDREFEESYRGEERRVV